MIDEVASCDCFRELLKSEAKELTKIGNKFNIRHSEHNQIEIQDSKHYKYLFHRLLSMIILVTNKT